MEYTLENFTELPYDRSRTKFLESLSNEEKIVALNKIIQHCKRIVFFGGAGVSTESGIPDFRSTNGLYNQQDKEFAGHDPEYFLSINCLEYEPKLFFKFYRKKMDIRGFEPNIAHKKLAEMEAAGKLQVVITQNIDGLHRKAGSKHVLEIHGSEERNYCDYCEHQFASDYIFTSKEEIPRCPYCGGVVRPDVVLYGEALPYNELREAAYEVSCADCMIIGGTSLNVYPAASLLQEFRGEYMILINRGETPADSSMDLVIRGSIGQVMSQIKVN